MESVKRPPVVDRKKGMSKARVGLAILALTLLAACTGGATASVATPNDILKPTVTAPVVPAMVPTMEPTHILPTATIKLSPTPTPEVKTEKPKIKILLFHLINQDYFTKVLKDHLVDQQETIISVDEYLQYLDGKLELPSECKKFIVITIDDGYDGTVRAVDATFKEARQFQGLQTGRCAPHFHADLFVILYFDKLIGSLPDPLKWVSPETPSYRDGNGKLHYMTLQNMVDAAKDESITIRPHTIIHETSWPVQLVNGTLVYDLERMFAAENEIYERAGIKPPEKNVFVLPFGTTNDALTKFLIKEGKKYNADAAFLVDLPGGTDPGAVNPNDSEKRMNIMRSRP